MRTLTRTLSGGICLVLLAGCGPRAALVLCKASSDELALLNGCQRASAQLGLAAMLEALPCAPDAVKVGAICVDKYPASVWDIDSPALIEKVQMGAATHADLTDGGATPISPSDTCCIGCQTPPFPLTFPETGNWTKRLYAASVEGVVPTGCITWLQAEQACALSGKRLLTNSEWQRAVAGTPEGPPCSGAKLTGTPGCVSKWGAFDMVEHMEWVADWTDIAVNHSGIYCSAWPKADFRGGSCVGGPGGTDWFALPGARHRGGYTEIFFISDGDAVGKRGTPFWPWWSIGFRCAR